MGKVCTSDKICILYGFPCEMGFFSPRVSESRPSRVATRVGFGDEWWEIHLTWKTIQNAFSRILYTLRHFNQAKYTVQSCRSWKPCEMDLSHNCSLHGGMSEVCENTNKSICVIIMSESAISCDAAVTNKAYVQYYPSGDTGIHTSHKIIRI